jgi:hypothetical protein
VCLFAIQFYFVFLGVLGVLGVLGGLGGLGGSIIVLLVSLRASAVQ